MRDTIGNIIAVIVGILLIVGVIFIYIAVIGLVVMAVVYFIDLVFLPGLVDSIHILINTTLTDS